MSAKPMRELVVEAAFSDPYDGVIRLLSDAQRFGFTLRSMEHAAKADGTSSATFTFHVPPSSAQLIAARLARHPTTQRLEAAWADVDAGVIEPLRVIAA
jgi:hypothetical protein